MKFLRIYFVVFFIACFSCKQSTETTNANSLQSGKSVKYATGFDIIDENGHKRLIIKTPYPKAKETFEFLLTKSFDSTSNETQIITPIQKIVVTSTTHIAALELLGVEKSLVGFQNTHYVSSEKTRARIDNGDIKELGKEFAMNTEILFELKPDAVIGFAMSKTNKTYNLVERNGIPVIINGDWLEETPLGRAEWIKFFGALFDKKKEADSIFKEIEADYLEVKEIASNSKTQPTVISGALLKEIWHSPGGKSFMANFFKDANLDYYWSENQDNGSLPLSFESVFEKGKEADVWIGCGLFSSKEELLRSNELYNKFDAFQNNTIYTNTLRKGATGGLIYYEFAPNRPDLVLKDMIKIAHPELLPEYELTFFDQLQ